MYNHRISSIQKMELMLTIINFLKINFYGTYVVHFAIIFCVNNVRWLTDLFGEV